MSTEKKIIFIDASSLKESSCLKKIYLNNFVGARHKVQEACNFKAAYGTSGHLAFQHYYGQTLSVKDCIAKALDFYMPFQEHVFGPSTYEDEYRTLDHLYKCLELYFKFHQLGKDGIEPLLNSGGEAILEQKFCFPYWSNDWYEIALCGIIDMQANYFQKRCIVDHKFTSTYPKHFFKPFEMHVQAQFYSMADKKLNNRDYYLPVLINGIFIKKPTLTAAKKGVWDGAQFERSQLLQYNEAQMQAFEQWLERKLSAIKWILRNPPDRIEEAFFNEEERAACETKWGLCKYFDICKFGLDWKMQRDILEMNYDRVEYNPLTWRE